MKLKRVPLNKQIYEQLKQDIMERRIEFGEKLTNRELQKRFGVSSTPVRDAINHLYIDGLVEDISNLGARVIMFDLQFVLEVNDMLSLLCCASVERASAHADHQTLCAELEKVLALQENTVFLTDDYHKYDSLFHHTFFNHCGNQQYKKNYSRYHVLFKMLVQRFSQFQDSDKVASIDHHRKILTAYREGNTALAIQHTKSHFLNAEQFFSQHMK